MDTTPPTGSITINSGATYTTSTSVTLTLSASDANGVASMAFSTDGTTWGAWEAYSTSKSWTLTGSDGTKTVYVKFKDNAGLESSAYQDSIILDTVAPTVTIGVSDSLISEADVGGTFTVTATFSEAMDKAVIPTVSFSPAVSTTLTSPGGSWNGAGTVYSFTFTVADANVEVTGVDVSVGGGKDLAGNLQSPDPTTAADKFSIDTVAPSVSITSPADNAWVTTATPIISGTSSDSGSGVAKVEVSVDGGAYSLATGTTSWSFTTGSLGEGSHSVTARATDVAGNHQTDSITVKVDTVAPVTSDDYDGLWHTSDFTITLTASDDTGSGVAHTYYKINDGPTKTVSADGQPQITTESATNKLEYWSVDVAGNEEAHHTLTTIKLDKTKPSTKKTLSGTVYDGWYVTEVGVTLSATDGTSGVKEIHYKLDGVETIVSASTTTFTITTDGTHILEHWAVDNAGNEETHSTQDIKIAVPKFTTENGFKSGDSPSFASDPYLTDIMCVLVKVAGGYKLAGTSPGTFDWAVGIKNTGATTFTLLTITLYGHPDFCLQSSNPIRVLDKNGNDITYQFDISKNWPTSITISSKSGFQLPASASLYVTIHLDYALKGLTLPLSSQVYSVAYWFHTTVSANSGTPKDAYGSVALLSKKTTIIYGFVKTSSGMPVEGAKVELCSGSTVYTISTDTDGFFCFIDGEKDDLGHTVSIAGGLKYTLKCTLPGQLTPFASQLVTAERDKAVYWLFTKP